MASSSGVDHGQTAAVLSVPVCLRFLCTELCFFWGFFCKLPSFNAPLSSSGLPLGCLCIKGVAHLSGCHSRRQQSVQSLVPFICLPVSLSHTHTEPMNEPSLGQGTSCTKMGVDSNSRCIFSTHISLHCEPILLPRPFPNWNHTRLNFLEGLDYCSLVSFSALSACLLSRLVRDSAFAPLFSSFAVRLKQPHTLY